VGGNEGAAAFLPDLPCDIVESIFNVDQAGDTPQHRRLSATQRAKQHREPGRWNGEHSLEREFPQRAAKLDVVLARRSHDPALA
jgi:hypothetical protein